MISLPNVRRTPGFELTIVQLRLPGLRICSGKIGGRIAACLLACGTLRMQGQAALHTPQYATPQYAKPPRRVEDSDGLRLSGLACIALCCRSSTVEMQCTKVSLPESLGHGNSNWIRSRPIASAKDGLLLLWLLGTTISLLTAKSMFERGSNYPVLLAFFIVLPLAMSPTTTWLRVKLSGSGGGTD